MFDNKKGFTIGDILPLAITLVVVAVAVGLGADVLNDIQTTQTTGSVAANVSGYGLGAMNTFGEWLPTIALIVVISVILGVLIVYLANRFGRA